MKRAIDVVASLVGLVLTSPLLVALSAWVRLDSPGPALFRQARVGRHGKVFQIHKLRTMHVGVAGPSVTIGDDHRVTRSGRFLRRTKLDELPQLFDVLVGSMSLVGPRPEVPEYVALWPAEVRTEVLSVRPGITDPTALLLIDEQAVLAKSDDPDDEYRNVLTPIKLDGYLNYVREHSVVGDVILILATVGAAMRSLGHRD